LKQKHVYGLEMSHAQKQPRLQNFLSKTRTKTSLITNSNYEIRQKKNTTYAKQKSNKILLQRRNKTRSWQENVPKIGVQQTKGNGEFYLYL